MSLNWTLSILLWLYLISYLVVSFSWWKHITENLFPGSVLGKDFNYCLDSGKTLLIWLVSGITKIQKYRIFKLKCSSVTLSDNFYLPQVEILFQISKG